MFNRRLSFFDVIQDGIDVISIHITDEMYTHNQYQIASTMKHFKVVMYESHDSLYNEEIKCISANKVMLKSGKSYKISLLPVSKFTRRRSLQEIIKDTQCVYRSCQLSWIN